MGLRRVCALAVPSGCDDDCSYRNVKVELKGFVLKKLNYITLFMSIKQLAHMKTAHITVRLRGLAQFSFRVNLIVKWFM